jgi:outer membrane protein
MSLCAKNLSRLVLAVVAVAGALAAASCQYSFNNPEPYVGFPRPAVTPSAAVTGSGQRVTPAVTSSGAAVTSSAATSPTTPGTPMPVPVGAITVSINDAVMMALANNQGLVVEKLNTPISRTQEENALAAFDPDLTGSLGYGRSRAGKPAALSSSVNAGVGVSQFFPTGTTVEATAETSGSLTGSNAFSSRLGMTVTQALLRGYGSEVNLVALRQSRLATLSTEYELRAFAETLVSAVEEAYWDYALAQRGIDIVTESLKLAEQSLAETEERIKVGKLAEIDRAAAQSAVALRRENLINARSLMATARLRLLRLLNPGATDFWTRDVTIRTLPVIPQINLENVEDHVQLALRMRPEMNQARLSVQRGDLTLVQTKNGLLPRMDVFVTLGKSGYAQSFGSSISNLDDRGYDFLVGASFEYPPMNRDARATHQRAQLTRRQAVESVTNLAQTVQVDVRGAYIEVERAKEQVTATAATRGFQEQNVVAETEKFRVGKSTTFLVAQAQRDLLQSQIDEISAVVSYLKAWVELYRLDGSLLERRGVECPGREPVEMPAEKL